jgi:hypothetical protein
VFFDGQIFGTQVGGQATNAQPGVQSNQRELRAHTRTTGCAKWLSSFCAALAAYRPPALNFRCIDQACVFWLL